MLSTISSIIPSGGSLGRLSRGTRFLKGRVPHYSMGGTGAEPRLQAKSGKTAAPPEPVSRSPQMKGSSHGKVSQMQRHW